MVSSLKEARARVGFETKSFGYEDDLGFLVVPQEFRWGAVTFVGRDGLVTEESYFRALARIREMTEVR